MKKFIAGLLLVMSGFVIIFLSFDKGFNFDNPSHPFLMLLSLLLVIAGLIVMLAERSC